MKQKDCWYRLSQKFFSWSFRFGKNDKIWYEVSQMSLNIQLNVESYETVLFNKNFTNFNLYLILMLLDKFVADYYFLIEITDFEIWRID